MTVFTAAGTRLYLGTSLVVAVSEDPADDATIAAAMEGDSFTEIEEVEDVGEFGDQWNQQTFASLKDSRVRKLKTTRDAGSTEFVLGDDPDDAGQAEIKAAVDSKLDFNIKVVMDDAPGDASGDTPTIYYFRAKVMSSRFRVGQNDNVRRLVVSMAINSRVVEIPREAAA